MSAWRRRNYTLSLAPRDGYLLAEVGGADHAFATLHGYWTEIIAELAHTGAARLMVVDALNGQPALHELVEIVNHVLGPALHSVRVALVQSAQDLRYAEFVELLLRRQGVAAHTFACVDTAEHWLRGTDKTRGARTAA